MNSFNAAVLNTTNTTHSIVSTISYKHIDSATADQSSETRGQIEHIIERNPQVDEARAQLRRLGLDQVTAEIHHRSPC